MSVKPCPGHRKPSYSSWKLADRVRHRSNRRNRRAVDDGSVYFCYESGGYHVTSWRRHDQDRFVARYPQAGDRPGDDRRRPGDRKLGYPNPVDNLGEATATPLRVGLERLLVGPAARGDRVRKFGGPTPDRVDRLTLTDETRPRLELEVTLPVLASPNAHPQLDTPIVAPPDIASYGDEIRPFDEYDADDERAS